MKQDVASYSIKEVMKNSAKACLVAAVALTMCMAGNQSAWATTGVGPYVVPQVIDINPDPNIVETYIVAEEATVNIGNGVMANGMVFKSCSNKQLTNCTTPSIPGPEFRLTVGNQVIVHYVNNLGRSGLNPEADVSAIHWHGIELNNQSDGTEVTQPAVDPKGGKFDYDFIVTRPGIFWYHPHHHASTNQVAKGLYGSMIIEDNQGYEATLRDNGTLPSAEQTKTLVLSDITVCGVPGSNPSTFDGALPHISGVANWALNYEFHVLTQSPKILCDTYPLDPNGVFTPGLYGAGDVPNIQEPSLTGRMSEGFTVLTNGVQVDARGGDATAPDAPSANVLANALPVQPGQGLRLQIVNPSPVRYMRLRLTADNSWTPITLYRIGGEGGLLNNAVVEGGSSGSFDTKYESGEILVPPAGRADVVAVIPDSAAQGSVFTLWQEDFQRVAATYSWTPTVPVMHLKVQGAPVPQYALSPGSPLLANLGGAAMVPVLSAAPHDLLPPSSGENGSTVKNIQLTFWTNIGAFEASIDGVAMPRGFSGHGKDGMNNGGNPFYLASARHAALSNTIELTVENTTGAHHPFHLHGFSFQPISLSGGYTFPTEFRDIVDVPANSTLTFRVSLDDRPTAKQPTGGGLGRWLFHCHILPHATFGMMSELHVHE
ncbi:MAG: multicopper oxidase family protein [Nitrospira sp.]|nr:multicopper oxidase family protein [Nitrospira sp.]